MVLEEDVECMIGLPRAVALATLASRFFEPIAIGLMSSCQIKDLSGARTSHGMPVQKHAILDQGSSRRRNDHEQIESVHSLVAFLLGARQLGILFADQEFMDDSIPMLTMI